MALDRLRADDLAECDALLIEGSRTFSSTSLLFPARVRTGATVIYAFCRAAAAHVEDASDKSAAVAELRLRLARVYVGAPVDVPYDRALAAIVRDDDMPSAPLQAFIDALGWEVERRTYDTEEDVLAYATHVAGSIGIALSALMGARERDVLARACDLGIAMQLTKIARDVGADARRGRMYLPRTWVRDAGIDPARFLERPTFGPDLGSVVARVLARAETFYRLADAGIPMLPRECRPAVAAARLVYADIGREIVEQGLDSVTCKAAVPAQRKAWLLSRAMGARLAVPRPAELMLPPFAAARDLVAASTRR